MCGAGRRCWRWIVCCDRKLPDVRGNCQGYGESNEEGAHHTAEDRIGKVIIPFVKKRALTMFKFNVLWLLCTSKDNAHVMVSGHMRFAESIHGKRDG